MTKIEVSDIGSSSNKGEHQSGIDMNSFGYGIPLCKKILSKHKGEFEISRINDSGFVVTLTLPKELK